MTEFKKLKMLTIIKRETLKKTPRTDKMLRRAFHDDDFERGIALCRKLERENNNLRKLLDKANQAVLCFVDLRGLTAAELKSAHNGICILLDATKMLDNIKAGAGEGG